MREIKGSNRALLLAFLAVLSAFFFLALSSLVSWLVEGDPNPVLLGGFLLAATASLLMSLVLKVKAFRRNGVADG